MGWTEWAKSRDPRVPVTVKIRTSGYQTLECLQHSQLRECMGVLCMCVKLLTDLEILGCELHKNAFGGRAETLEEL